MKHTWKVVIDEYGNERKLAEVLGVSRQRVYSARSKGQFPAHWAAHLHRITNGKIRADVLRPDIFGGICP